MFKKQLPIIFIGLCVVIAALVLGWSVFIKSDVEVPVVDDGNKVVSKIDISDWKDYKNEEYGFEFKYPANLVESEEIVNNINHTFLWTKDMYDKFKKGEITESYLWITNESLKGLSLEDWIETKKTDVSEKEHVILGDMEFLRIYEQGYANGTYLFYVTKENTVFTIGTSINKTDPVLNQILSTFKFIEKDETSQENIIVVKKESAFIYNLSNKKFEQLTPDGYRVLYFGYDTYLPVSDKLFALKNNKIFLFNVNDTQIKETVLPTLKNDNNVYESVNNIMLSQDKTRVLVTIGTYDKTSKEYQNVFGGPQPISTRELDYDIQNDKYENSNILKNAKKIVKNDSVWFKEWDSKNNKLFGHRSGEGIGNTAPVYIVDLNKNTFQKTPDYGEGGINPYFAASLDKFILVDGNSLLLFNSSNLNSPQKTIDIKNISDQHCQHYKSLFNWEVGCSNLIYSIAWSSDENQIAIGLNTQIYTIDLNSNESTLRFSDETLGQSMYWKRFTIIYSSTDRYLFFVDCENNDFKLISVDMKSDESMVLQSMPDTFDILFEKFTKKDETADWKSYGNEEYGFEFKYPKEWLLEEKKKFSEDLVELKNNNNFMEIFPVAPGIGLEFIEVISSEDITIDGKKFTKEIAIDGSEDISSTKKYILVKPLDHKNPFVIWSFCEDNYVDYLVTFDEILSTFKFIEK